MALMMRTIEMDCQLERFFIVVLESLVITKTNFEFRRGGTNILFSVQIGRSQIDNILDLRGNCRYILYINSVGSKTRSQT